MPYLIPTDFRRPGAPRRSEPAAPQPMPETQPGAAAELDLVGIEARTRITTSFGDVPAHLLRVNDTLRTHDGRFLKIRAIDALRLDEGFLRYHPDAFPIRIAAGALGSERPQKDIYLAPNQEILIGSGHGGAAPLRARDLLSRPRVVRDPGEQVIYFIIDLGQPAMILSEKIWLRVGQA